MSSDYTKPLGDLEKAKEEEYFHKQNKELAAKLKARLELENVGLKDEGLIAQLNQAGFNADKCRALFLVPILEVAWADGKIQDEERAMIFDLVRQRNIEESSEAYALVKVWLSHNPKDEAFFRRAHALVGPITAEIQKSGKGSGSWILEAAENVARATGGVFGFGSKVSKEEAEALQKIAARLQKA